MERRAGTKPRNILLVFTGAEHDGVFCFYFKNRSSAILISFGVVIVLQPLYIAIHLWYNALPFHV